MKKILLGNEAVIQGALSAGVDFVSGYPGCPSAEIGDEFGKLSRLPEGNRGSSMASPSGQNKYGIYYEQSTNEKVALEAAIGASFSGLKSLVDMKSFGLNVCADSLYPLAYTGTKAGMVIVVGDDPSCHSSAQSEQNSRGYAYLSHIPILEPADPQECYDFTKLGFEISEKFNIPVILRTTTRVAHQRMPVTINPKSETRNPKQIQNPNFQIKKGVFVKDFHRFSTLPPRVMEMKKELLEKIERIRAYSEKLKINRIENSLKIKNCKLGIVTSGVTHLYVMEVLEELEIDLPVLKINMFYPLAKKTVGSFIKDLKKVLVVEELDGYLEKEIKAIAKDTNPKLEIYGKNLLSEIGELNAEKVMVALSKILKLKIKPLGNSLKIENWKLKIPPRHSRFCEGCPHVFSLSAIKRAAPDAIFGGDIGCYMMAGLEPFNMQDYLFSMGAGMGISHGVKKATNQKVISLIGDATFFHAGIPGLINTVYNKSSPLFIVLDNRTTAMTGNEPNPGMGETGMGEAVEEIKIEEIAKACGVKNIKVLDPINAKELEGTVKEFLEKDEVSVIICRRICALLAKRQNEEKHNQ